MNETSVSLLDRACDDSESESWTRLASIYTPLLQVWLQKHSLQASDVDDLVQEVLLTVARELPEFQHSGRTGAFRKWLRGILVHRLQNFWRTNQRARVVPERGSVLAELAELEDDASQASQLWDSEHDRHVLSHLMTEVRPRFHPKTWEAFQRQMFRGEKGRAVAEDLNMSLKAVQLAKSRVLHALRTEAKGLVDGV
jgi:RNA polymerase sigma-70 factor, ECF subfamily